MLTDDERSRIREEAAHYPTKRAASIEALVAAQARRGWVSDETLEEIASVLEMSPADLDGVATFYNEILRKPVGRHIIRVCDSVSCWIMGYEHVRDRLSALLGIGFGETTPDGRFTMIPVQCLGACDHAPVFMVDEETHRNVDPAALDAILERYP